MTDESLQWNDGQERCDACGRVIAPRAGYRFYADKGTMMLCPSCYQDRLTKDSGGSTHDMIAEVDGGSG